MTPIGMKNIFGDTDPEKLPMVVPDDWVTTTVNCRAAVSRKRQAMRAHHSQINDEFPLLAMPEEVATEYFHEEHFHLATSRVPVSLPETDVFSGIEVEEPVSEATA